MGKTATAEAGFLLLHREGSNTWALNPQFVEQASHGRLVEVMPQTLEYAVSLACNQACVECSFGPARRKAGASRPVPFGEFADPASSPVADLECALLVLQRAHDAGVKGVIWTGGGEPTLWKDLPAMIRAAAALGMTNGLYTNGAQIGCHPELAKLLLHPNNNMMFIRVSVNAVTPETARRFSGASAHFVEAQQEGLKALFEARASLRDAYGGKKYPSVQVSTIVDRRNVEDLVAICRRCAEIAGKYAGGIHDEADDFVVRPLTLHGRPRYGTHDHDEAVIDRIVRDFGPGGEESQAVRAAGMNPCLGFGLDRLGPRGYSELLKGEYEQRDQCRANGLFLTVSHDATVHLCCDRNCDPDWTIGNLRNQSVAEIYAGERRRQLLDLVHSCRCGPATCEATCRTVRLNRIARALANGAISDAMLEEVRQAARYERPLLLS